MVYYLGLLSDVPVVPELLPGTSDDCHPNPDGDTDGDHDRYQDHDGDDDFDRH